MYFPLAEVYFLGSCCRLQSSCIWVNTVYGDGTIKPTFANKTELDNPTTNKSIHIAKYHRMLNDAMVSILVTTK